jgi:hypothetical protein
MPWFDLTGDARLGRCATEGCGGQPTSRLEANGVGSNYCSGCREKIEGKRGVPWTHYEPRVDTWTM